jgi:hypothetical protein
MKDEAQTHIPAVLTFPVLAPPKFDFDLGKKKLQNSVAVRTEPKVSRNALCPCGSAKKHKKCCGQRRRTD